MKGLGTRAEQGTRQKPQTPHRVGWRLDSSEPRTAKGGGGRRGRRGFRAGWKRVIGRSA